MADYLSRHPSPFCGAVIKSEQMFNNWFTIIVVNKFAKDLDEAITAKGKKSTQMISGAISQSEARTHVFTVSEQNDSVLQTAKMNKSVRNNKPTSDKTMCR